MATTRRNIVFDADARDAYVRGVRLLKQEFLGPTTDTLGIDGPTAQVSTYDLFVVWHHRAMQQFTPPNQADRNAAHRGPVFLPWHRYMLLLLELQLQRVLDDPDIGLPYWDWAADGERSPADQRDAAVWGRSGMGGDGSPISRGPFAYDADDPASWRVRVDVDVQGRLRSVDRGLRRAFGNSIATLPTLADVAAVMAQPAYDEAPWGTQSDGLRNHLEGWRPLQRAPGMHNRVHVWVGGDMLPSSSPNDPVFYLNHCNADRIWTAWQANAATPDYLPGADAPIELLGHRIDDDVHALLTAPVTPRQMLDVSQFSSYDSLAVTQAV